MCCFIRAEQSSEGSDTLIRPQSATFKRNIRGTRGKYPYNPLREKIPRLQRTDLRQGQAEARPSGLTGGSEPLHQPPQGVLQLFILKESQAVTTPPRTDPSGVAAPPPPPLRPQLLSSPPRRPSGAAGGSRWPPAAPPARVWRCPRRDRGRRGPSAAPREGRPAPPLRAEPPAPPCRRLCTWGRRRALPAPPLPGQRGRSGRGAVGLLRAARRAQRFAPPPPLTEGCRRRALVPQICSLALPARPLREMEDPGSARHPKHSEPPTNVQTNGATRTRLFLITRVLLLCAESSPHASPRAATQTRRGTAAPHGTKARRRGVRL